MALLISWLRLEIYFHPSSVFKEYFLFREFIQRQNTLVHKNKIPFSLSSIFALPRVPLAAGNQIKKSEIKYLQGTKKTTEQ